MNRGVYEGSLVQQMMGRSSSLWSVNNNLMPPSQEIMSTLVASSSTSSSSLSSYSKAANFNPMIPCHENQELPDSWSQLLLGGVVEEEEDCSYTPYPAKRMDSWEYPMLYTSATAPTVDVKEQQSEIRHAYNYYGKDQDQDQEAQAVLRSSIGSTQQAVPASSPSSCVLTSFSSNILDFSNCKAQRKHQQPDHSSECNSNSGSAFKKARVQASAQSPLKVRKEKLGDRIAALHQLVSPFGKTDTASVLLEAIGYVRFLQGQIEALSSPYLGSRSRNTTQSVKGDRNNIFVEEPGQLLNDGCMKRIGPPDQDADDEPKDLRSRGLCLMPVSFTLHVGSDNGADFWAPNFGMGFR